MSETYYSIDTTESSTEQIQQYYENLISYIRSRLNVIVTSVYLLESNWPDKTADGIKYFHKINEEIEAIRKLINE